MSDIWTFRAKKMEIAWEIAKTYTPPTQDIDERIAAYTDLMGRAKEELDKVFPEKGE